MNRNFKENTQAFAVKAALGYLEKDPEKNFPKLLAWGDKFDVSNTLLAQRKAMGLLRPLRRMQREGSE